MRGWSSIDRAAQGSAGNNYCFYCLRVKRSASNLKHPDSGGRTSDFLSPESIALCAGAIPSAAFVESA